MIVDLCGFFSASISILDPVAGVEHDSWDAYLKWSREGTGRHAPFLRARKQYIADLNTSRGGRRLRDWTKVKAQKSLKLTSAEGRRIVDRSKQIVPLEHYKVIYSNSPPPDKVVSVMLFGQETPVVFVDAKHPAPPHHYDVEDYMDSAVVKDQHVASVQSSDASDADEVFSKKHSALLAAQQMQHGSARVITEMFMQQLCESQGERSAKELAGDDQESQDEESDEEQEKNHFVALKSEVSKKVVAEKDKGMKKEKEQQKTKEKTFVL